MGWGGGQIKQRVFKPFEKLLDELEGENKLGGSKLKNL